MLQTIISITCYPKNVLKDLINYFYDTKLHTSHIITNIPLHELNSEQQIYLKKYLKDIIQHHEERTSVAGFVINSLEILGLTEDPIYHLQQINNHNEDFKELLGSLQNNEYHTQ